MLTLGGAAMKVLFQKGNRLFTGAWVFFMIAAVGHSSTEWPDEEALNTLAFSMENYVFETGTPLNPTALDVFWGVWLETGVLMLAVAALNLVALGVTGGDRKVKRALLKTDIVFFVPLTALFVVYPIPPPLIVFGAMSLLLLADLLLTRKEKPTPAE